MSEKNVIFFISKETNKFIKYQVIEKTKEELAVAIEAYYEQPKIENNVIIIEDQYVIDAILSKQSKESIENFLDDIKDVKDEIVDSIDSLKSTMEEALERIKESLE
jgi:gas vesicle protein